MLCAHTIVSLKYVSFSVSAGWDHRMVRGTKTACEHIQQFLQARSAVFVKFTHKLIELRIHFLIAICKKINESSLGRCFKCEQENICN